MTEAVSIDERYGCAAADGLQRDVVAAMAFAPGLAALLKRAKYAQDHAAFLPAVLGLAALVRKYAARSRRLSLTPHMARRFATLAIAEWLHDVCPVCSGAGHVARDKRLRRVRPLPRNTPMVACRACEATGLAARSDRARSHALGVDLATYRRTWGAIAQWTAWRLTSIDSVGADVARQELQFGRLVLRLEEQATVASGRLARMGAEARSGAGEQECAM